MYYVGLTGPWIPGRMEGSSVYEETVSIVLTGHSGGSLMIDRTYLMLQS